MKIVCISDTHEKHKQLNLPKGDVLIHAGDFTWVGKEIPTLDYLDWFESQPFKYKIFVSGNHDFYFEHGRNLNRLTGRGFYYLMNSEIVLDKQIRIWGSPFTPEFMNWAFMGTPSTLKPVWDQIPEQLDILITHGPPFQILDRTLDGFNVGCPLLLEKVKKAKPKYHIFGHIHEGYGMWEQGGITFINASLCNADYHLVNQPVVIKI
jgi:Icc-related predicted phosphoesterase